MYSYHCGWTFNHGGSLVTFFSSSIVRTLYLFPSCFHVPDADNQCVMDHSPDGSDRWEPWTGEKLWLCSQLQAPWWRIFSQILTECINFNRSAVVLGCVILRYKPSIPLSPFMVSYACYHCKNRWNIIQNLQCIHYTKDHSLSTKLQEIHSL